LTADKTVEWRPFHPAAVYVSCLRYNGRNQQKYHMILRHLAIIFLGYLCAVIVAGFVLALPLMGWMLSPEGSIDWWTISDVLGALGFYCALVGVFSLLPAVVAIAAAERLAIISPLSHMLGGAAIGLASLAIMVAVSSTTGDSLVEMMRSSLIGHAVGFFVVLVLIAGISAGLVFWLVVVRWRGPQRARSLDAAAKKL
jgi:hypothetical protein